MTTGTCSELATWDLVQCLTVDVRTFARSARRLCGCSDVVPLGQKCQEAPKAT
jgi:hypothetical protein